MEQFLLHGAYEAIGASIVPHITLGQTKVGDLDMAIGIKQHIFLQNSNPKSLLQNESPDCSALIQVLTSAQASAPFDTSQMIQIEFNISFAVTLIRGCSASYPKGMVSTLKPND